MWMRKLMIPSLLIVVMLGLGLTAFAQDDGSAEESTGPQTTVEIFYIVCESEGVMNLTGFATPGFDIFYQLFNGSSGTGDALTSLRRVNVDGDYAFSERIAYRDGQRVAPGAIGSARVIIAETTSPEDPVFETTVDDIQDGCNDAQNPLGNSDDAGDPVREEAGTPPENTIANPDGGILNPELATTPEPAVVLGPRRQPVPAGRTANPGLVFAMCDSFYPQAAPGLIYDTDGVRVFWYWFAQDAETLVSNLAATNYAIRLNGAPLEGVTAFDTERDGLAYRFFIANLGNLRPGWYEVEFKQNWSEQINDGFDDFGPGTGIQNIQTNCNFEVVRDPAGGTPPRYNGQYIGGETPAHDFERVIVQRTVVRRFLENFSTVGEP